MAHVPKKHRVKLDSKVKKGKMHGYELKKEAYRLWDIAKGQVFSSRVVKFFEKNKIYSNQKVVNVCERMLS